MRGIMIPLSAFSRLAATFRHYFLSRKPRLSIEADLFLYLVEGRCEVGSPKCQPRSEAFARHWGWYPALALDTILVKPSL